MSEFDPETLGRQAIEKTLRGRNPQKIEPGEYTVVLEHYVTEDIVNMLNFTGVGAQAVLEGRSWMNERIGQQPSEARQPLGRWAGCERHYRCRLILKGCPSSAWTFQRRLVMGPVYDRYTAGKMGKTSTGHAVPATMRGFGPIAMNIFMAGGRSTLDEMIRSTERGLYVNRFWYTRPVHPRDCVITGMTRDGVFMIENGELTYPVKNLRFTQSYVQALANVEAVGKDTHLLGSDFGGFAVRVPALKVAKFNFTGVTA